MINLSKSVISEIAFTANERLSGSPYWREFWFEITHVASRTSFTFPVEDHSYFPSRKNLAYVAFPTLLDGWNVDADYAIKTDETVFVLGDVVIAAGKELRVSGRLCVVDGTVIDYVDTDVTLNGTLTIGTGGCVDEISSSPSLPWHLFSVSDGVTYVFGPGIGSYSYEISENSPYSLLEKGRMEIAA